MGNSPVDEAPTSKPSVEYSTDSMLDPYERKAKAQDAKFVDSLKDLHKTFEGAPFEGCICVPRIVTGKECFKKFPGLIEWKNDKKTEIKSQHYREKMIPFWEDDKGGYHTCPVAEKRAQKDKTTIKGCRETLLGRAATHKVVQWLTEEQQVLAEDPDQYSRILVFEGPQCPYCANPERARNQMEQLKPFPMGYPTTSGGSSAVPGS